MGAKIHGCQHPERNNQEIITEENHIIVNSTILQDESMIKEQVYEVQAQWGKSAIRKQTVVVKKTDKNAPPPRKSVVLAGILAGPSQNNSQIIEKTEFVVPEHVTKTLLIMPQLELDPKLVEMFSDCQKMNGMKLSNGAIYEGQWSDGIRNGFGRMLYQDQSYYEGFWINNERHFIGRFIDKDGDGYVGEWFADEMHGNGKFYHPDNTVYEIHTDFAGRAAKIRETMLEPNLTSSNGNKYYGEVVNNTKHGFGVLLWPDGTEYYGYFKEGKMEGYGVMSLKNGQRYEGQFEDDHMHGIGTFTWPDGNLFVGNQVFLPKGLYEFDQKEGYGMKVWPNGNKYRGQFKDGQISGFGRLYNKKTGKVIEGQWEKGRRASCGSGTFVIQQSNPQSQQFDSVEEADEPENGGVQNK